jgi:hypothetical protein
MLYVYFRAFCFAISTNISIRAYNESILAYPKGTMMQRFLLIFIASLLFLGIVPTHAQEPIDLTLDEAVTLNFTPSQILHNLTITVTEEDTYNLSAIADNYFGLLVRIFDASDQLLEDLTLDSLGITFFDLMPGTYTIVVAQADITTEGGDVEIRFSPTETQTFNAGEIVTGEFTHAGDSILLEFAGTSGQMVNFILNGDNMGYELYAPDGSYLIGDGYWNDLWQAFYELPQDGTYALVVRSLNITPYQIRAGDVMAQTLEANVPLTGTADVNNPPYFAFSSSEGKVWQINATTPNSGDLSLRLLDNDKSRQWWDKPVIVDYGSGGNNNPRISPFSAPRDDIYYVALVFSPWDDATTFEYEISLAPDTKLSLVDGTEFTGEITADGGNVTYEYVGFAGEDITLTLTRLSEEGALGMVVYSSEDEVMTFNGRNVRENSATLTLPLDGTYRIVVSNISYDTESILQYSIQLNTPSE